MKLVIAGSRTIQLKPGQIEMLMHFHRIEIPAEIVSGGAAGVDTAAMEFAKDKKLMLSLFEPDWDKNGKAAGPIRNFAMAAYGDVLLLIWDGKSKGSASMRKAMMALNKPVYEVILRSSN